MAQRWFTKEDVLEDLNNVSSGRIADVDDGFFLYGEQAPPPPHLPNDEEKDIERIYGQATAGEMQGQGDTAGPDLFGITQMLRMFGKDGVPTCNACGQDLVQNYESSSDEETVILPNQRIVISKAAYNKAPNAKVLNGLHSSKKEKSPVSDSPEKTISKKREIGENSGMNSPPKSNKAVATQVALGVNHELDSDKRTSLIVTTPKSPVISKLNPNVKEFVPKNAVSNTSGTCSYISTNKNVEIANDKLDDNSIAVKKVFVKDRSKEEKKEIAMILKKQIPVKNDTFEEQRKTNLAIVKLLKLYAEPEEKRPLKLLPPEFFEKTTTTELETNNTNVTPKSDCPIKRMALLHSVGDVGKNEALAKETEKNLQKIKDDVSNNCKNQDSDNLTSVLTDNDIVLLDNKDNGNMNETTQLTPDMENFDIIESPVVEPPLDPNMKESIDKVNNWLDDKPVVPICDIKKIDLVKEKVSPVLSMCAVAYKRKDSASCKSPIEITSKKHSRLISDYMPSSYAEELHKKFTEKSTATAPAPVLNIWEKLEADLKKKDSEVKKLHKKT